MYFYEIYLKFYNLKGLCKGLSAGILCMFQFVLEL